LQAELFVNGTLTTSINSENNYLFNANDFEPIQFISKGIIGAFYLFINSWFEYLERML